MADEIQQEQITDWRAPLLADPEVAPHVSKIQEKDFVTFAKSKISLEKKLGDAISLKDDPGVITQKLREKGILPNPPEKYEIKRPDGLPEGAWNEALEEKAHAWGKKHGLSQEAVAEAFQLYQESIGQFGQAVEVDRKASLAKIKEWADKEGVSLEQVDAALDRFNKDPRGWDEQTAELVSKSGFADHPLVVQAIYKLMSESGTFDVRGDQTSASNQISADESEVLAIMAVLNQPGHPDYAKTNTADNQAKIDNYWKKKAGGAQYQIS